MGRTLWVVDSGSKIGFTGCAGGYVVAMSDPRDGECPTCGDLGVDIARAGDVVTMQCVDSACGREFEVSRAPHAHDWSGFGRVAI